MSIRHPDLIATIETFIAKSGMSESYFGKKAVGNSELLARLRRGGRVWPETEARALEFIASELAIDKATPPPP